MNTAQVLDKPSNKALDEVLVELRQGVFDSTHNTNIRTYNKLSQLALTNTATITEVIEAMPINTIVMIDAYTHLHVNMDIPVSGQLVFYRSTSVAKAYVDFKHEFYSMSRTYNTYYTPALQGWVGVSGSTTITASSTNNKAVNVPCADITYYFTSTEAAKLTDKPSGSIPAGVIVSKKRVGTGSLYLVTYTQNNAELATWQCTVDGSTVTPWVSRA